jgi:Ca-activated chloride channel family protein
MFNNINLEYPWVLLLLFLFIVCNKFCKAKAQTYYMPHLDIYNEVILKKSILKQILKWAGIVLAIIALSSPIKIKDIIYNKTNGIDIIISLDTSASMKQIGFNSQNLEQNRWEVVQDIVKDFILKRVNDNIGIVVFGSSVMTASPLTYDKKAQMSIIDSLDIGIVGKNTALIDSIATSINILSKRKTKSKIIIVLTDGVDTASTIPYQVVQKMAQKYKIKIYTIGIGDSNQPLLNKLAKNSNGKAFIANNKNMLNEIYQYINKLEKSKIKQNKIILKKYLFYYPLFVSFLCLLFFVSKK